MFSRNIANLLVGLSLLALLPTIATTPVIASERGSIEVHGSSHVPSCPGYFSTAVFQGAATYRISSTNSAVPAAVTLVYSLRNAWTGKSWALAPKELALASGDGHTWEGALPELIVDERGHLHMSHLELAVKLTLASGDIAWDNGGLAPLGFYSFALPQPTCTPGAPHLMQSTPMASAADYR
ncbi:MAG: hypothetical protein FJ146_18815 [Deltaproteobacteria bacterium]|nr:hypothetical protein [Deltaproteobacteria bacterium]